MIGDIEYYTFNNQHMQAHNFLIAKDIKNRDQRNTLLLANVSSFNKPFFLMNLFGKLCLKTELKKTYFRNYLGRIISSLALLLFACYLLGAVFR